MMQSVRNAACVSFSIATLIFATGCGLGSDEGSNNGESDAGGGDTESSRVQLVSPSSWTVIPADEDPFDDAPSATTCEPESGLKTESFSDELAFGVKTAECPSVALRQSSLGEISEGDTVFVRAWHFELTAPVDAEAHLGVAIDGETVWEDRIPIPTEEGGLLTAEWTAPRDIPVGSEIVFHAHNHGNNEYYLIEVSVDSS